MSTVYATETLLNKAFIYYYIENEMTKTRAIYQDCPEFFLNEYKPCLILIINGSIILIW